MRQHVFAFACLCSAAAIISAVPLPAGNQELDVLQIPLANGKEIDVLTLGSKDQEQSIADRNKRTIGLLRELFPDITKEIDSIVNRIIAQVIRVAGPSLLPTLLGGNNRATTESNSFDADFDDNDDDDDISSRSGNDLNTNNVSIGTRVLIDLPTFPPETRNGNSNNNDDDSVTTTTTSANRVSVRMTSALPNISNSTVSSTLTNAPPTTPSTTTTTTTTTPSPQTTTSTTTTTTPAPTTTTTPAPTTTTTPAPTTTTSTNPPPTTTTTTVPPPTTTSTTTTTETPTEVPTTTSSYSSTTISTTPTSPATVVTFLAAATTVEPATFAAVESTLAATTATTTTSNQFNVVQQPLAASDVDESQLVAIIDNINLLLNSTNYFITTRDNLTTSTSATTTTGTSLTPLPTDTTVKTTKLLPNGAATDTQIDLSAINKQLEETIRVARQVKEAEAAAAVVQTLKNQDEPIQLSFNNEVSPSLTSTSNQLKAVNNELQLSESKSPAIDELTLDSNEDTADLDDRNKRFLSFGGNAGLAGGASGGSSAGGGAPGAPGSGNFLFDIVRLFSGSVQTQGGDESANSANSVSGSSDSDSDSDANRAADGYTEGIPGPVTRLVVLANRGLANLVQDLILRVAATSEKFVNFKAKLITALI